MKNILSLVVASVFCVGAAQAADPRSEAGILAGVNIGHEHISVDALGVNATGDSDTNTRFLGGFYAQYHVHDGFFIEPQIRFDQRGGSYDGALFGGAAGSKVNLTAKYIDIPVYAKYKFVNTSAFLPYVFAGPKFGFKVGSSGETTDSNGNVTSTSTDSTGLKSFEFSIDAGIGAEVMVTDAMSFGITGAYSWGLTKIADTGTDDVSLTNRGVELYGTLGWAF